MAERVGFGANLGFGIALAVGLVGASYIASDTLFAIKSTDRTIEVKGYAERLIVSDIVVWEATLTATDADLSRAYAHLENDKNRVLSFLEGEDIKGDAIVFSPTTKQDIPFLNEEGNPTNKIESYKVSQRFSITSSDVSKIAAIATKIDRLNMEGIQIRSESPQFYYTSEKLNQIKLELLGEATKSANERAQQIAANSGIPLGKPVNARQGIFQVTAENSTDISDSGVFDVTSMKKIVKLVVTLSYAIAR